MSDKLLLTYYSIYCLGTQFKAIVEYAPSQHVPKQWSKKDGREGTILKGIFFFCGMKLKNICSK